VKTPKEGGQKKKSETELSGKNGMKRPLPNNSAMPRKPTVLGKWTNPPPQKKPQKKKTPEKLPKGEWPSQKSYCGKMKNLRKKPTECLTSVSQCRSQIRAKTKKRGNKKKTK